MKTVDASANPYLALGAVLAAGLDGVERSAPLPDPVDVDPGHLSEEERAKRRIRELPATSGEAIRFLESDPGLVQIIGPRLAEVYLAVRTAEWEVMKGASLEDEVQLLWERY